MSQTVLVNNRVTENTGIEYMSYGDLQTKNNTKRETSQKTKCKFRSIFRVSTFNVCTLAETGRLDD
jgi:hypothetical protein